MKNIFLLTICVLVYGSQLYSSTHKGPRIALPSYQEALGSLQGLLTHAEFHDEDNSTYSQTTTPYIPEQEPWAIWDQTSDSCHGSPLLPPSYKEAIKSLPAPPAYEATPYLSPCLTSPTEQWERPFYQHCEATDPDSNKTITLEQAARIIALLQELQLIPLNYYGRIMGAPDHSTTPREDDLRMTQDCPSQEFQDIIAHLRDATSRKKKTKKR